MTTISWKQIDSNNNGYVDGNEAADAMKIGVKNVWDNMTEADYASNVTREQKLSNLVNIYTSSSPYSNIDGYFVVTLRASDRNEMKKDYANSILFWEAKLETLKKEEERLCNEFHQKFNILDTIGYDIKETLFNNAFCEVALSICTLGKYEYSYERTEDHVEYLGYRKKLSELRAEKRKCYDRLEDSVGYYESL